MGCFDNHTSEFVIDLNIILRTPFNTSTRSAARGVVGCFEILVFGKASLVAGADELLCCPLKYAKTSPFKMRPCGPVAFTRVKFNLFSLASRRTAGVVATLPFSTLLGVVSDVSFSDPELLLLLLLDSYAVKNYNVISKYIISQLEYLLSFRRPPPRTPAVGYRPAPLHQYHGGFSWQRHHNDL